MGFIGILLFFLLIYLGFDPDKLSRLKINEFLFHGKQQKIKTLLKCGDRCDPKNQWKDDDLLMNFWWYGKKIFIVF